MAVDDFAARHLGGPLWLAAYLFHQLGRATRRSIVQIRHADERRAAYCQGAVAADLAC
jgi:hypothetical protein